ncbi:MAG: nitroreductase family protein, partial [Parabacteroides sp.]|nr:nitroreductase family protein [Parabacteroides sp.]
SDLSKMRGGDTPQNRLTGAMDTGIVSQNISIACAGMGLATVPRGTMDKEVLAQKLKLKATQVPFLNHPVGFAE